MRLNPFAPNDNPMDQVLFCFGSGEEDNKDSDGALGYELDEQADYLDRVAQEVQDTRSRGDDTDELEDYYSSIMGDRLTGGDIMSVIDRSTQLSPSPNVGGGGDDQSDQAFAVPDFLDRGNIKAESDIVPRRESTGDIIQDLRELNFVQDARMDEINRVNADLQKTLEKITGPRKEADIVKSPDVDIFDTAYTGGATPAAQVIEQARGPGTTQFQGARPTLGGSGAQTVNDTTVPTAQSMAGVNEKVTPGMRSSAMTMAGVDKEIEDDFDGGDVGDFSEFVPPEIQKEMIEQGKRPPRDEGITALAKPGGIVKNIVDDLTNRNASFAREVQRPGNRLQTDAQGNITGVYNPQTNSVYTPESVGLFDLKAQQKAAGDLYKIQRAEQENRRGRGGDDDRPVVSSTAAPATTPEEYIAQGFPVAGTVSPFFGPYSPATQYTGIAGLPQFTLQPTYTAPTMFSPLYNIG